MKRCTKCDIEKPLSDFSAQARGKFGVTSICKPCTSERGKAWAKANPERKRIKQQVWAQSNAAALKAYAAGWRAKNEDKEKQRLKLWTQSNKAAASAKVAARRAAKLKATPAWADKAHIAAFYRWARECTEATGIKANVDHVVPLVSDVVCGLHCPANLCLLTEAANKSKGNAWDVNMTFYP